MGRTAVSFFYVGHAKLIVIRACGTGGLQMSRASVRISMYLFFAIRREKVGARSAENFGDIFGLNVDFCTTHAKEIVEFSIYQRTLK